jgi:hypothetical protein
MQPLASLPHESQRGVPSAPGPRVQPARRSRLLAATTVVAGLLTALLGFVVFGVGMGFANATAAGSGAAAFIVGLWMVLAVRGVARRRLSTYIGLTLAWVWLIARVVADFPAVMSSFILVVFLLSAVTVPVVIAWVIAVVLAGAGGLVRLVGAWRQWRCDRAAGAARGMAWPTFGLGVRTAILVAMTFIIPPLVWTDRGQKIEALAGKYAPAAGEDRKAPAFGACSVVFLGYELTQPDPGPAKPREERLAACADRLADAKADLASIAAAGARYVRMGASGDHLFEDNAERAAFQESLDDQYMDEVRRTGIPAVLVDCQHAQRLPHKPDWQEFCAFQRKRIEYYQRRYHPAVYIVVCEPMNYHYFTMRSGVPYSPEEWVKQLSDMCRLIKSVDPATRTGICLLVMDNNKPEWDVWTRMKTLPELDILSVEIYEPKNFGETEERLKEFGHPADFGKAFWIAETYNGCGALCQSGRGELAAPRRI